ncbi:hypothetical protein P7K49_020758, partial [Saguinus oedipus]
MRSVFASLALALAPRFLTYTQTLAPRPPHALPSSHPPTSPLARTSPEQRFLPASPPQRALPPHAARPPVRRALTGAPPSPGRSGA